MKQWKHLCLVFACGCSLLLAGCGETSSEKALATSGPAVDTTPLLTAVYDRAEDFFAGQDDEYTTYFSAQEYKTLYDDIVGSYSGIGAYFYYDYEEEMGRISDVMRDTPAAEAGIRTGDLLWKVDGEDVTGVDLDLVVAKIKGQSGTTVDLTFLRDGEPLEMTLTRSVINVPTLDKVDLEDYPDIAYIYIDSFNSMTAQEFWEVWGDMQAEHDYKGIILDLRYNLGGELNAAIDLADAFIPQGNTIVWLESQTGEQQEKADAQTIFLPLVVLANEYSASASEIFMGAVQDNGVGTIVGTQTYGKGIIQTVFPLKSGAGVRATTARYLTPNRNAIHGVGITPDVHSILPEDFDITLTLTADPAQDPQLADAIEVLQQEIS